MENPVKILLDEHKLLLQGVETARRIQKIEDNNQYYKMMHDMILFFRNFSELYHHPKEEIILYPVLLDRSQNMSKEFMHEICDNHEDFKALMAEIENYYMLYDYKQLRRSFGKYLDLLSDHILRENKIILSAAGSLLSDSEQKIIVHEFEKLDNKQGDKKELINSIHKLSLQVV